MAAFAVLVLPSVTALAFLLPFFAFNSLLHHRLICSLFSLLDLEQRVRHNLRHGIALGADRWSGGGTIAYYLRTLL
jgi:hypothetical protein